MSKESNVILKMSVSVSQINTPELDKSEFYFMLNEKRGMALIIVQVNNKNSIQQITENKILTLKNICINLGFKVEIMYDLTKHDLIENLVYGL